MDASMPVSAKQLKEHLQHQQEPFSLHNYLSERGYMLKNLGSDSRKIHSLCSAKNLKWSNKDDMHKVRKRFLSATEVLRSLLYKFIPTCENQELENWDSKQNNDQYVHGMQRIQQKNELSSVKRLGSSEHLTNNEVQCEVLPCESHRSTLVSMLQTYTLPKFRELEVSTDTKPQCISMKKKQQCSTESELEELSSNEVRHFETQEVAVTSNVFTLSRKSIGDLMFSSYLRRLLVNSYILKSKHAGRKNLQKISGKTSLHRRNKRVVQKMNQLLFACVEKARECHEKESKNLVIKALSEPEDLQNIIHERLFLLEKQYGEVKKVIRLLLHTEPSVASEDWEDFKSVNKEIGMEIGDAIMDDIVKDVIDTFLH